MGDVAKEKLNALQMSLTKAEEGMKSLCDIRPDIYSIRRVEWTEKIRDIERSIKEESILMFIGPFSAGKSSFVNALLGEEILPTANTPCTAVVTEITFTEGGGNKGRIFLRNNPKDGKDMDFYELKNIINGPTGAHGEVASYHHVEMILDVTENKKREQFRPFIGVIRIVDCPGFGSPYYANEDIIENYIEKSSFTFWMSPCDKIGGRDAEERLRLIKKNTTSLIPLITKSDLITDEDEREKIRDDFYETLSSYFKTREPHFVSALQFKKARELEAKLNTRDKSNAVDSAVEKQFSDLLENCGINWVLSAMQDCATQRKIDEKKVDSLLFDVTDILKDISSVAISEKKYWEYNLTQKHWNPTDKKFSELEAIKDRTDSWIKGEAKRVSDSFKNDLTQQLISNFGKGGNSAAQAQMIQECWQKMVESEKDKWIKYMKTQYIDYIRQYNPIVESDVNLTVGKFEVELINSLGNVVGATLESLRSAGTQSVITASLGATLLASTTALGKVALVGKALAGVACVAGPALLGVAILPLIPVIIQGVKTRGENDKRKRENDLRQSLDTLNVAPSVEEILKKTHTGLYEYVLKSLDSDIAEPKKMCDLCESIARDLTEELKNISIRLPAAGRK